MTKLASACCLYDYEEESDGTIKCLYCNCHPISGTVDVCEICGNDDCEEMDNCELSE